MKVIKFILTSFEYIWNQYCAEEIGCKILGKEEFSSEGIFPLLWGQNKELGIKVLVFLGTIQGKFVPFVFVSVDKNKHTFNRKLPIRLKSQYKNVGDFHFFKQELESKNIQHALEEKCKSITKASFQKTLEAVCRPKRSKKQKEKPRSVYTISGGLYGLGKNRKH